jgi:uncharacterized membrane protein
MIRVRNALDQVRSSYWFVPGAMAILAIVLSFVTIAVDQQVQYSWVRQVSFFWSGGADGARGLLSTVAGSMITVAGVVFSITLVVLSLASSQFGPRLLRNFMRDTGSQVVLGTFIATFVYCLLVLRTIRSTNSVEFVPYISVTVGLVLALASLAVLIFFIHHIALAIQAPVLVANVAGELLEATKTLFPADVGRHGEGSRDLPPDFDTTGREIKAGRSGYIQAIEDARLLQVAKENDLILQLLHRPGYFVTEGRSVLRAWPGDRVDDDLAAGLARHLLIGKQRTPIQDIQFNIEQLVEVAVRALSPGINDPFTAISCIDWLGAALCRLAGKDFPAPERYDDAGYLRLVVGEPLTFTGLVDAAFDQIRHYSEGSPAVRNHLLEIIAVVAEATASPENRQALERQAAMIKQGSDRIEPDGIDQWTVNEQHYSHVLVVATKQEGAALTVPGEEESE